MQAVADIIRTTLGPRSMLKMLLDATGGALHFEHMCMCVNFSEYKVVMLL